LDTIGMEDVKFHYALQDTTIGQYTFPMGFHFKGTLKFLGFRMFAEAQIDVQDGFYIRATIDPINITVNGFEVLKLTSATDETKGALFDLDLRKSSNDIHLIVSGAIGLLGGLIRGSVNINVDGKGFYFLANCKIFNVFEGSLEVRGSSIDDLFKGTGTGIYLKASMKNDLLAFIRDNILAFIRGVTATAVKGLTDAQNYLVACQEKVSGLDTQIAALIVVVKRERVAMVASLVAAQNVLTNAQNGLNAIDRDIQATYNRISQRNSEISWYYSWYNSAPWWEKGWKWAVLVAEVGWRAAEIGVLYAKIGALYVARAAAWAALEVAKAALRVAEGLVNWADPALDPRVLGLVTARATVWAVLKVAEGAIIVAKAAVSGFSSVTQFIVQWGLGGIFNITSASFEANFNSITGRTVNLSANLVFLGTSQQVTFSFNFDDPLSCVKSLAESLLKQVGALPP